MLAGKGEHLRGGRAEAAQEHPNKQQNEIVAVPGNNTQAKTPSRQQNNQAFAIAFSVGTPGQKLADQDANDGAPGEEEANHRRTRVDFVGQKQAQRRRFVTHRQYR